MEGRLACKSLRQQWSGQGPAEPRNGGGAKAYPLELAKEENGRAIRTSSIKTPSKETCIIRRSKNDRQHLAAAHS